jgi:hypothetical protein
MWLERGNLSENKNVDKDQVEKGWEGPLCKCRELERNMLL